MRLGHVVRALDACKLRKCAEHKVRAKIRTHFRKACRETSFELSLCRTSLLGHKDERGYTVERLRSTIFVAKIRRGATNILCRFRVVKCSGVRKLCVCHHCLGYDRKNVIVPGYDFCFENLYRNENFPRKIDLSRTKFVHGKSFCAR